MNEEDALNYLIRWLRGPRQLGYHDYGYDAYLPNVIRTYLQEQEGLDPSRHANRVRELSPVFYEAAWELCRRGIIRPGVRVYEAKCTEHGHAGGGHSITSFGRAWLAESDHDDFVPTEPGRFAAMLKPFQARFGPGFYERAQEAVRCYGAHAYLACCAMCGAAAESILLAVAVAKRGEEEVLRTYRSASGRSKVENDIVLGQAREELRREFRGYSGLLKYWRDEASHGRASKITDNEALTSLALLLRFAQHVNDHWNEIVGTGS